MRDEPTLIRGAIEELLPYDSPVQLTSRVAKVEAQIAIPSLLRRLPALRLETDALRWRDGIIMRGLTSLPLSFGRDGSVDSAMLIAGG